MFVVRWIATYLQGLFRVFLDRTEIFHGVVDVLCLIFRLLFELLFDDLKRVCRFSAEDGHGGVKSERRKSGGGLRTSVDRRSSLWSADILTAWIGHRGPSQMVPLDDVRVRPVICDQRFGFPNLGLYHEPITRAMPPSRSQLLNAAQGFCTAFADKKEVDEIMSHFSTSHTCSAIEYGESCLAPFLGKRFDGLEAIQSYFTLLSKYLSYKDMSFSEFVIDTEVQKVSCKGKAKFTWTETGQSWDETFAYMLDFDDEGRITDYQVWADSGAAYVASKGNLDESRKVNVSLLSRNLVILTKIMFLRMNRPSESC